MPSTAPPRDPSALASVGHRGRREGDVWPTGGRQLTPGPRAFGLPEGGAPGSSPFCARLDATAHRRSLEVSPEYSHWITIKEYDVCSKQETKFIMRSIILNP